MTNPIKYYRHVSGPLRKIVKQVWDSDGQSYSVLSCGHAVRSRFKRAGVLMSPNRVCILCNERRPPSEEKIKEFEFLEEFIIEQALLEGKRRRAVFYFVERKLEVPAKLQQKRFRMALYDDFERIVPPC